MAGDLRQVTHQNSALLAQLELPGGGAVLVRGRGEGAGGRIDDPAAAF